MRRKRGGGGGVEVFENKQLLIGLLFHILSSVNFSGLDNKFHFPCFCSIGTGTASNLLSSGRGLWDLSCMIPKDRNSQIRPKVLPQ